MTPAESRRRLLEFVADPEGAYPVIRETVREILGRRVSSLILTTPKPETAYAELMAEHKLYLEWAKMLEPEKFVELFAPKGE